MQDQKDGITLEVSSRRDGVPLSRFITKMKGLLRALSELDAHLAEDHKRTVTWVIVQASYNSPLTVRVASKPLKGRTPNKRVAKTYVQGVKMLEEGAGEPSYFTRAILATTKRVLKTNSKTGGQISIYASDDDVVQPTKNLARNIDQIMSRNHYQEYTTLEGTLDALNIHERERPELIIYDILTDYPTKCYFDNDLRDKAVRALGRRVAVTGLVTYNRLDDPVFMKKIEDIKEFRDSADLPHFLEGEAIDITGGLNSVEYVRRARDAE